MNTNPVTQFYFIGYNGEIKTQTRPPFREPIIEVDSAKSGSEMTECMSFTKRLSLDEVKHYFGSIYKSWGRFGYLGDVIAVKELELDGLFIYFLDFIGRLAIIKPGLAADLVPIIKVSENDYYFVGVKRRYSPGQGLAALMGGFNDVRGYDLDTPLETVIHEAKQEIGLTLRVTNPNDLRETLPTKVAVEVDYRDNNYQDKIFHGELLYRGIIKTGMEEMLMSIGLKRVYTTTVYALFLDMTGAGLNKEKLGQWLKAGDDAASLVIVNLKDRRDLRFGLGHHTEIFSSLMQYMEERKMI